MNNNNKNTVPSFNPNEVLLRKEKWNDAGHAESFANRYQGELSYIPQQGKWLSFEENHWKLTSSDKVKYSANLYMEGIQELAKKLKTEAKNITDEDLKKKEIEFANALLVHTSKSLQDSKIKALLNLARCNPKIAVNNNQLDANDMALGIQNGVLEFSKDPNAKNMVEFREADPSDFISKQANVTFTDKGFNEPCSAWEKFLEEVQPNPEVRKWLQKFIGYCLTGSTAEQKLVIFQGSGSNGKSVFIEIVNYLLGSYATTVQFESFCEQDRNSSPRNDIAILDKVRLVIANEGQEGARLDEGMVKQLTGGDDITARLLYQENITFKPRFKIVLIANHKPVIKGTDNGIWRRLILIPWEVTIDKDKQDKRLVEKLKLEINGILAWALQGLSMYLEDVDNSLALPECLIGANENYRKDSDIIGQWLDENIAISDTYSVSASELYSNYEAWTKTYGYRALSQKSLAEKLKEKGFNQYRTNSERGWKGLKTK